MVIEICFELKSEKVESLPVIDHPYMILSKKGVKLQRYKDIMTGIDAFDNLVKEYDQWFDEHPLWFESEVKALEKVIPQGKFGLEIGIGSARFAEKLFIDRGLDPSEKMVEIARKRGIKTKVGKAESMPFEDNRFDYAVMVTVDCFLEDIPKAFQEVRRVLKSGGEFINGMIDKDSPLGQTYEKKKVDNPFYKHATFHSPDEITALLKEAGFGEFEYWQTLITASETEVEVPRKGYGEGGFVVIKAHIV